MALTSVDPVALSAAAQRIDTAADLVDAALRTHLPVLQFGPASAGRMHAAAGAQVHDAVDRLRADLAGWAHAARALAGALNSGAERYRTAEQHAATVLR